MTALVRLRRAGSMMAACCLAIGGLLFVQVGVHAYPPPTGGGVVSANCSTASAGQQCTITATFTDAQGNPLAGVQAVFSVSACGSVNPTTATTDRNGQATTVFTAGTGKDCCGPTTITATAGGQVAQTTITITCPGVGLPPTGTAAPSPPGDSHVTAILVALIAGAVAIAGLGFMAVPRAFRRRPEAV